MKKTGAWLVRYALEQVGVTHTFGIPGVHNTEIYDELEKSSTITPLLVTHEGCGAFMADAVSRTSSNIGTMVIVPAAGVTHAASGIGEAFLDGIPMLVVSGGVRTDSQFEYQLHDIDQHKLLEPITKGTFKVTQHKDVVSTIYQAYELATGGEPGPVFIEVPVNIQLDAGPVESLPEFTSTARALKEVNGSMQQQINKAADMLADANHAGLFLGWGAVDAATSSQKIAEELGAPVATTLQGLSAFPANHPLHVGMGFGPAAVPAATAAFKNCDCLLAVGTRFSEIATGSFGVSVPENLIHIDINPQVFDKNFPSKISIEGDAKEVLPLLAKAVSERVSARATRKENRKNLEQKIATDKQAYQKEWLQHDSGERVNVARFFHELRSQLPDDGFVVADDGNHTFLTAELMPIHMPRHFISPTDFNCMGYAVPAAIATKIVNPDKAVVGIIGDGAFLMTCMELLTATTLNAGVVFTIFNDGELAQISQAQSVPYNRKTCTTLGDLRFQGVAEATGAAYLHIKNNAGISDGVTEALNLAGQGRAVILDVCVDYSKKTRFTQGIVGTNIKRLPLSTKARMIGRALWRRVTPA